MFLDISEPIKNLLFLFRENYDYIVRLISLIDNQDDHAKNFSFLYDKTLKRYRLSPAYDITPGKTYWGEHTTSINGKGKNITKYDMLQVASKNKINIDEAKAIIETIENLLQLKIS